MTTATRKEEFDIDVTTDKLVVYAPPPQTGDELLDAPPYQIEDFDCQWVFIYEDKARLAKFSEATVRLLF